MKCKNCEKWMRISVLPESNVPIEIQDGVNEGRIISFKVVNCKITSWTPTEGLFIIAEGSDSILMMEEFEKNEFWTDIDDESGNTVIIEEFSCKFVKKKSK